MEICREVIGLGVRWVGPRLYVRLEPGKGRADLRFAVEVLTHKSGRTLESETKKVVQDKHLTITIRSGTDAQSGSRHFFGNDFCDLARNSFQHYGKYSGFVQGDSI